MKTTIKLYETAEEIDAACVAFHKRGQSLQSEAHKLACSVLKHVGEHGDVRVVMKLVMAIPEMGRANAVRAWFEHFGPVTFDQKGALHVQGKKTRLGEAMEVPFWKFKPEEAYQPLDPAKKIEALIKALEKDAKETKRDHGRVIAALKLIETSEPEVATEETEQLLVIPYTLETPELPTAH